MANEKINWFPGHMAKTRRLIQDNLKLVDAVIIMMDARVPISGYNPLIEQMVGEKPALYVLAKSDLAEPSVTAAFIENMKEDGRYAIACELKSGNGKQVKAQITDGIRHQTREVISKRKAKGIIDETIRIMVVGIPNVGKSTLINLFAGKNSCETGDRPGVTKTKKWIKLDKGLDLLDMPGILWPNIQDPNAGLKLAVTGAVGENAFDITELGFWLCGWLKRNKPGKLAARYEVDESLEDLELLDAIGKRRGFLRKGGIVEEEKTAVMLVGEVKAGKLGPITWDSIYD